MIVSRTGYTGELGYELYFKGDEKTLKKFGIKFLKQEKNLIFSL